MKSVQIRSFFLHVFSCIQTEYGDLQSKSPYLVQIHENRDQKKFRTEIYRVNLRIQSKYMKTGTRKSSVFGHVSRSVCIKESKSKIIGSECMRKFLQQTYTKAKIKCSTKFLNSLSVTKVSSNRVQLVNRFYWNKNIVYFYYCDYLKIFCLINCQDSNCQLYEKYYSKGCNICLSFNRFIIIF